MKKIQIKFRRLVGVSLFILGCTIQAQMTTPFVTTWEVTDTGGLDITIPTANTSTYSYTVNWGDNNVETGLTGGATHTYATAGTYTVSITGTFPRIVFYDANDFDIGETDNRYKIKIINQWGNNPWESMEEAFGSCINLDTQATDSPNLSNVTNIQRMFIGARSLSTPDLSSWDVSNVTDMREVFAGASVFNGDVTDWNVSSVENMRYIFFDCPLFNQDLSSWDVSNVTDMREIFASASAFNGNISSWNVSNANNMGSMFRFCSAFNQDLSGWDVSKVTDMESMFFFASAFDQDLSSWNISNVTTMDAMFVTLTISTENYDAMLTEWSKLNVQPDVVFNAGNSKYCNQSARDILTSAPNNWVISDSGQDESSICAALSVEDNLNLNNFVIHPSPVQSKLTVGFSNDINNATVEIYNIEGKRKASFTLNNKTTTLDVSRLSSGFYLVKIVVDDAKSVTKKILIE